MHTIKWGIRPVKELEAAMNHKLNFREGHGAAERKANDISE